MKNWTLIGDVGGWDGYHVGDEAMLEANVNLFQELDPAALLTVVSSDPGFTSRSTGVEAVPRLGFDRCTNGHERDALLAALASVPEDKAPEAFRRLATPSDGLVISGAGNLTSAWPNLIFERLAFCRRAARVGARIIILGQTIGPALEPRHREMVGEMLRLSSWVGVREAHSFALGLALGASLADLSYQLDDATSLGRRCSSAVGDLLPFADDAPWIALTFHPIADPTVDNPLWDRLAAQLKEIAVETGCRLVFIPHARAAPSLGAPWADEDVGKAFASRLPKGMLVTLPIMKAREVAGLTGRAHMIISSRYHPLVFGLAAAVPSLAIWTTEYTHVKLQGALSHYGRDGDGCSIDHACDGELARAASKLWKDAAAIRSALAGKSGLHAIEEQHRKRQLRDRIEEDVVREVDLPRRLFSALASLYRQAIQERDDAKLQAEEIGRGLATASASLNDAALYAKSLEVARAEAERYTQSLEKRLNDEEQTMALLTKLTEANLALAERCAALEESAASAAACSRGLETQLDTLRKDRLERDDMREENRRLRGSVAQLQGELITLSKVHAELVADNNSVLSENERLQAERHVLQAHASDIQQAMRSELGAHEAHASDLQQRLGAMHASRSWRVTRPLRRLKDMYNR